MRTKRQSGVWQIAVLLVVLAATLGGCMRGAIPGLTTPDHALNTPAPLPPPGEPMR
ncbi:MAG: hypothetical protein ACR2J1_01860 [Methyloceanibacter sp.]|uniref:hypothetical protein n=1 Tax=Methyloceanibacter sp. TaxID=1965321 RepID=UPI003D9B7344